MHCKIFCLVVASVLFAHSAFCSSTSDFVSFLRDSTKLSSGQIKIRPCHEVPSDRTSVSNLLSLSSKHAGIEHLLVFGAQLLSLGHEAQKAYASSSKNSDISDALSDKIDSTEASSFLTKEVRDSLGATPAHSSCETLLENLVKGDDLNYEWDLIGDFPTRNLVGSIVNKAKAHPEIRTLFIRMKEARNVLTTNYETMVKSKKKERKAIAGRMRPLFQWLPHPDEVSGDSVSSSLVSSSGMKLLNTPKGRGRSPSVKHVTFLGSGGEDITSSASSVTVSPSGQSPRERSLSRKFRDMIIPDSWKRGDDSLTGGILRSRSTTRRSLFGQSKAPEDTTDLAKQLKMVQGQLAHERKGNSALDKENADLKERIKARERELAGVQSEALKPSKNTEKFLREQISALQMQIQSRVEKSQLDKALKDAQHFKEESAKLSQLKSTLESRISALEEENKAIREELDAAIKARAVFAKEAQRAKDLEAQILRLSQGVKL